VEWALARHRFIVKEKQRRELHKVGFLFPTQMEPDRHTQRERTKPEPGIEKGQRQVSKMLNR